MNTGDPLTSAGPGNWLRSHRTLTITGPLGLVVVLAAATGRVGRFTGPRWLPHWHLKTAAPVPPSPHPQSSQAPGSTAGSNRDLNIDAIVFWAIVAVAVVTVAYVVWRVVAARTTRATPTTPDSSAFGASAADALQIDAPAIRRGIELARQLLAEDRTPGDAIMLAWLGLEQSAEDSGIVRKPAETPTEFTSRIMKRAAADDRAISTLLGLYLRIRFGDHEATTGDVERAREALDGLLRSWDARASTVGRDRPRGLPL